MNVRNPFSIVPETRRDLAQAVKRVRQTLRDNGRAATTHNVGHYLGHQSLQLETASGGAERYRLRRQYALYLLNGLPY